MGVTARATVDGALKLIGVLDPSESVSGHDAEDGLTALNGLLDAWNVERLNIFTIAEVVATFGGASATIGPGQQIDTARPMRIESAFYRRSGMDYPLAIIDFDEYDAIPLKTVSGDFPQALYYTGDAPTGQVFVFPVPSANEYHLQVQSQLTAFEDFDAIHELPPGYARALKYALAVELAPTYGREPSASVMRVHVNSMRALKRANVIVPKLSATYPGNSGTRGRINILSNR